MQACMSRPNDHETHKLYACMSRPNDRETHKLYIYSLCVSRSFGRDVHAWHCYRNAFGAMQNIIILTVYQLEIVLLKIYQVLRLISLQLISFGILNSNKQIAIIVVITMAVNIS